MMKQRASQRAMNADQAAISNRAKAETLANGASNQQSSAAQARKRRSSINVYDQPSSLNSRLRQLETDMLRLDEDRTKLFDDTHSALAQYELKLGEIHAILKSRQDNVEKYVEDMRTLLQAKEDFEKQTKLLNEKHDRIHEKFTHRETIISREIKLLKNKFEVLEKNRQFRTMFQKSATANGEGVNGTQLSDDINSGLDGGPTDETARKRSETGTLLTMSELDSFGAGADLADKRKQQTAKSAIGGVKNVRLRMSNFGALGRLFEPVFNLRHRKGASGDKSTQRRRKSNKVSSIVSISDSVALTGAVQNSTANSTTASKQLELIENKSTQLADNASVKKKKKPTLFRRLMKS